MIDSARWERICMTHLQRAKRLPNDRLEACCPVHEDKRPSLVINLLTGWADCHAGSCSFSGTLEALFQRAGLPTDGTQLSKKKGREPEACYVYRTEHGENYHQVLRYPGKEFKQQRWTGAEWEWKAPVKTLPYRLPELAKAKPSSSVVWVEGEKDADRAAGLKLLATTSPGGVEGFGKLDLSSLAVFKGRRVLVLPDNDPPGRRYALRVALALKKEGADPRILDLAHYWPNGQAAPVKADLSDWLAAGGTKAALLKLARDAFEASLDLVAWRSLMNLDEQSEPEPANVAGEVQQVLPEVVHSAPGQPSWAAPTPLEVSVKPAFPVEAFPGPVSSYCQAVGASIQVPVDLPACHILSTLAVCLQKKVVVQVTPDWRIPVNLWTLSVYPSGGGKSASSDEIKRPVEDFEFEMEREARLANEETEARRDELESELDQLLKTKKRTSEDEQRVQDIKRLMAGLEDRKAPDLFQTDITMEALVDNLVANEGRAAILNAEACAFFEILGGRYQSGQPNFDVLLQGYSQETIKIGRVIRGAKKVRRPTVSLGLSVQPVVAERLIKDREFSERGLLGRFLFCVPDSLLGYREMSPPFISAHLREGWVQLVRSLLRFECPRDSHDEHVPHVLNFTVQGRALFQDFRHWVEENLRPEGELEPIERVGTRLPEQVAKVAGLLHMVIHHEKDQPWEEWLSADTVEAAIRIVRWSMAHAMEAHGYASQGPLLVENARYLWKKLQLWGWSQFGFRDLFQRLKGKYSRFSTKAQLEPALELLEDHGFVREAPRDPRGGKAARMFLVNPLALNFQESVPHSPTSPANPYPERVLLNEGSSPGPPLGAPRVPHIVPHIGNGRHEGEGNLFEAEVL